MSYRDMRRALRLEETEGIPVWFMRQAGRYMRAYRDVRKRYTIRQVCMLPDVVSEVMEAPVQRLGVDAAILFSDITLPLEYIGMHVEFQEGIGPVVSGPVPWGREVEVRPDVFPLRGSVEAFRKRDPDVPVIGFCGGPLTVLSYVLSTGTDRELEVTRKFMLTRREEFMEAISNISAALLQAAREQVSGGVDAVQVFDSWLGALSPSTIRNFYLEALRDFVSSVRELGKPVIFFSTGTSGYLEVLRELDADIYSLDWRVDLARASSVLRDRGIQGNLDPYVVSASREECIREAMEIKERMKGRAGYIFNLGHGVRPDTDEETLRALAETVHGGGA
ncbi:uroporphyrinogen decarboxylase [Thermogymnomonas acidicola]|uniref:Uroporphyrinogen decarboxylase n=1 Tax=Thermogymnomonas acidicola TaxID=399579 RepID=A0AA37F9N9_9ARCH|nr:uroporphyrinogen decarboxylase [Thermogymnomonas acidicola]GGM75140.1 uroporphyrinogen decarboxylase [Thermogymnomonas acidicola]